MWAAREMRGLLRTDWKNDSHRLWQNVMHVSMRGSRAIFSSFGGDFLTKLHRKPGEGGIFSTGKRNLKWRKFPKLAEISVACRGRTCPELYPSFSAWNLGCWGADFHFLQIAQASWRKRNKNPTEKLQEIHWGLWEEVADICSLSFFRKLAPKTKLKVF